MSLLSALHFLRPWWLLALLVLPVLAWWWRRQAQQRSPWREVVDAHLLSHLLDEAIEVLSYTTSTAEEHAVLLDHVRQHGRPRGAHDLIIAAHARQSGRLLISRDARACFGDLPGVEIRA